MNQQFQPQERVRHIYYGVGTVVRLCKTFGRPGIIINFDGHGQKEFILELAAPRIQKLKQQTAP
jgi:hypothetical protein